MAERIKFNLTRKQAAETAIAVLNAVVMGEEIPEGDHEEAAKVLRHWADTALVSAKAERKESPTHKRNAEIARQIAAERGGEQITTKDVVAMGIAGVTTTQRAAAILKVADQLGLATKVTQKGKTWHQFATVGTVTDWATPPSRPRHWRGFSLLPKLTQANFGEIF